MSSVTSVLPQRSESSAVAAAAIVAAIKYTPIRSRMNSSKSGYGTSIGARRSSAEIANRATTREKASAARLRRAQRGRRTIGRLVGREPHEHVEEVVVRQHRKPLGRRKPAERFVDVTSVGELRARREIRYVGLTALRGRARQHRPEVPLPSDFVAEQVL